MDDIAQEEALARTRLPARVDADVRQEVLLEELDDVLDAALPRDLLHLLRARADVVARGLDGRYRARLVDGRPQRLEHLRVLEVVDDVRDDLLVVLEVERAEDDDERHVCVHVGQDDADVAAAAVLSALAVHDGAHGAARLVVVADLR